jgi:hypothetical protein
LTCFVGFADHQWCRPRSHSGWSIPLSQQKIWWHASFFISWLPINYHVRTCHNRSTTRAHHVSLSPSAGQGKKAEEATETKNFLPKKIRLRSTLLINIRTSVGIEVKLIPSISFILFSIYRRNIYLIYIVGTVFSMVWICTFFWCSY